MWKTKISHILELYDGYTGQPADAGQFCIETSGRIPWMPKDNGCMVFCDGGTAGFEISLKSRWYLKKQVFLKNGTGGGRIPVQRVWVFPGPAYPRQKWQILKPGEAPPLCPAVFFPVMAKAAFGLYRDVGKQDTCLWIFHRRQEHLEGREILLYPQQIRLVLGEETEPFCFALSHSLDLRKEIKKTESRVLAGYEGITRADGSFQIAVPGKAGNLENSFLYIKGQEQEIIQSDSKEV